MRADVAYLNSSVWATLKPSPIHGVGVFAIRDIPKGRRITDYSVHDIRNPIVCELTEQEFDEVHPAVRALILDRTVFPYRGDSVVFRFYSPNSEQTLTSFMNHSDTPNSDGVIALRDILEGEEVTENFRELTKGNDPHPLSKSHFGFLG